MRQDIIPGRQGFDIIGNGGGKRGLRGIVLVAGGDRLRLIEHGALALAELRLGVAMAGNDIPAEGKIIAHAPALGGAQDIGQAGGIQRVGYGARRG